MPLPRTPLRSPSGPPPPPSPGNAPPSSPGNPLPAPSGVTRSRAQGFDPDSVRRFRFLDHLLDLGAGRIDLGYRLEGPGVEEELREVVDLGAPVARLEPARIAALERAVELLHLVAGVSYYKTCFAAEVAVEKGTRLDAELAAFLRRLYDLGLAECRYVNGLEGRRIPDFPVTGQGGAACGPAGLPDRPLVPIGGGKDSIVTLEAVRSCGRSPLLFSVGDHPAVLRTAAVAGLPHVVFRRRLDPRLLELNRAGAINGHVPVTAVVTCLALIAALIHGASAVVMADERSASVGSVEWDGIEVNHQYSKGWDFERRLGAVVRRRIASDLSCFSLLRPWSELAIARRFASLSQYHHAFLSCNHAYREDPSRRSAGWCCDCPKCRFVALALAPFLDPDRLVEIMGRNLLDDPSQLPGFAALLGIDADKPLECVGEVEEGRVAMRLAARSAAWRGAAVVRVLNEHPLVRELPDAIVEAVLAPAAEHGIPEPYRGCADALG